MAKKLSIVFFTQPVQVEHLWMNNDARLVLSLNVRTRYSLGVLASEVIRIPLSTLYMLAQLDESPTTFAVMIQGAKFRHSSGLGATS